MDYPDYSSNEIDKYKLAESPYNREDLVQDEGDQIDWVEDPPDEDDAEEVRWTVENFDLNQLNVDLTQWGRIKNPLTKRRAVEIALLVYGEEPSNREVQNEIDFIEAIDGIAKLDTYKGYRQLPPDDPNFRNLDRAENLRLGSAIARWLAGEADDYHEPQEAFDVRYLEDGPGEILTADYNFDRKILGSDLSKVPISDAAIAEVLSTAIEYPSVLRIWNVYQQFTWEDIGEFPIDSGQGLSKIAEEAVGPNFFKNHVWAHDENRVLYNETRLVTEYFYITAFNLEDKYDVAEGTHVIDPHDVNDLQRRRYAVVDYWATWEGKKQLPAGVRDPPGLSLKMLDKLEKICFGIVADPASHWEPSDVETWTVTDRIGIDWSDGIRGLRHKNSGANVLYQRHPNIPADRLSKDNLPAFYRKLSCQQACDLLRQMKACSLTQSLMAEFWPADFNSGGGLLASRKPYREADPNKGEDLDPKQLNRATVTGSVMRPRTPMEKNLRELRTFTSMGRLMVKDAQLRRTSTETYDMFQKDLAKKEEELIQERRKRKFAESPRGVSKRAKFSGDAMDTIERDRLQGENALLKSQLSIVQQEKNNLAEHYKQETAKFDKRIKVVQDQLVQEKQSSEDAYASCAKYENFYQQFAPVVTVLSKSVNIYTQEIQRIGGELPAEVRYNIAEPDFRNPEYRQTVNRVVGTQLARELRMKPNEMFEDEEGLSPEDCTMATIKD